MKKILLVGFVSFLSMMVSLATPVFAGDNPNILIMGEDADEETMTDYFSPVIPAEAGIQ